jgi:hypothetical protein
MAGVLLSAFSDVVSEPPEIDHISARAQGGRPLDQGRLKSGRFEPEGQRGSRNPCPPRSKWFSLVKNQWRCDLFEQVVDHDLQTF